MRGCAFIIGCVIFVEAIYELPHLWEFSATISYGEVIAYPWVKRMNDKINRKHPMETTQQFDFHMNLFAFV